MSLIILLRNCNNIINIYSGEKNKPTVEDLNSMFTDYVNTMKEARTVFNPSSIYEGLDIHLQSVIDNNKFDVTLGNLKSFFADVQENMPTDGDKEAYLKERFNDFIENGYTPDLSAERDTLKRQSDELYKKLLGQGQSGNENTGDVSADDAKNAVDKALDMANRIHGGQGSEEPTLNGNIDSKTVPTPEELEQIRNRINGIVDSTFLD